MTRYKKWYEWYKPIYGVDYEKGIILKTKVKMAKDSRIDILEEEVRFYKYEFEKAIQRASYANETKDEMKKHADQLAKVAQNFEYLDPTGQLSFAIRNYIKLGVLAGRIPLEWGKET